MSVKLFKDFDEKQLTYSKLIKVNDRFTIVKIWNTKGITKSQSFLQLEKMKLLDNISIDKKDNKYKILLELTEKNKNLLTNIDQTSIGFIRQNQILQQIHMETGVNYKAKCIKYEDGETHEVKDALKLTFVDDKMPTLIFDEDKNLINKNEINKSDFVKVIIEITHVVFDLTDKTVTTNVVLRQIKRCRPEPIIKVLDTYSFIDSDTEPETKIQPEIKVNPKQEVIKPIEQIKINNDSDSDTDSDKETETSVTDEEDNDGIAMSPVDMNDFDK
jgi:hypothetical protein